LQPIKESALGNIPTIAFCDTDSPMRYVDIGIPANNKGRNSIGCLFWLLARMVLQMRGTILPGHKWEVMVCKLRMLFKLTLDMQCVQIFYYPCILMCYAVCRLICSSTETLRKQRSTRRKLLLPLTLPLSLIIQRLISGVETSGPLMLLHRLLLLLALVPSGVLLQVCAENFIIFVMEPLLKCTLCSNGSYSPDHLICRELLMCKFVVNTVFS